MNMNDSDHNAWYLNGYVEGERLPRRFPITTVPFRFGRNSDLEASLAVHHVSGLHAEIYACGDELWLRDHESSNGTFLNRNRVKADVLLREGDIIHVSTNEFVLEREASEVEPHLRTTFLSADLAKLPEHFVGGTLELRELLDRQQVVPHYQPVVDLSATLRTIGFEVLGRGGHDGLPTSPGELFQIAESAGLEVPLSCLFRRTGLDIAQQLPDSPVLYVNSHPAEMGSTELLDSLREIRLLVPDMPITLEAHEAAVQDAKSMRELRAQLTALDIGLAYDDFGKGQARLLELIEVPPDVLKFDISLVRDIDRAPKVHHTMLKTLVSMVNDMGIACLAEGIERSGELAMCQELGFTFGQGYFLGRPAPVEAWLNLPALDGVASSAS